MFNYKYLLATTATVVALTASAGAAGYTNFTSLKTIALPTDYSGTTYASYIPQRIVTNADGDVFILAHNSTAQMALAGKITSAQILAAIKNDTAISSLEFVGTTMSTNAPLGLAAAGDSCYVVAYSNYCDVYKYSYVKSTWALDTAWATNGVYAATSAQRACTVLGDGRLLLASAGAGFDVLKTDGTKEGTINRSANMTISGYPRNVCSFGNSTNTFYSFVSGAAANAVQKVEFNASTLACTQNCKQLPAALSPTPASTGDIVYAEKNGYGTVVITCNSSQTAYVFDENLNTLQTITDLPATNLKGTAVIDDGADGQYLLFVGNGNSIYVYSRATVPVTLSGFELE